MAITSLNQLVNALGNQKAYFQPYSFTPSVSMTHTRFHFYNVFPGLHGSFNFTGTNLAFTNCDNTTAGTLFPDRPTPASGENIYLAYKSVACTNSSLTPALLYLVDIIGYYFNINTNTTTTQTLTGTVNLRGYPYAYPVFVASTATGSNNPNLTLNYTNHANVANRTSTTGTHSSVNQWGVMTRPMTCNLQGGDYGVRSVQSITFASATTGSGHLLLVVPIVSIPLIVWNLTTEREFVTQIPALPVIPTNACLGLIVWHGSPAASGNVLFGNAHYVVG